MSARAADIWWLVRLWRDAKVDLQRLYGSDPETWHPRDIAERGVRLVHIEGSAYRDHLMRWWNANKDNPRLPVTGGAVEETEVRLSPSRARALAKQRGGEQS